MKWYTVPKYVPHNTVNHFHDNFIDDMEEVNDDATFFPQGSKNRAESQAKENDTQGVGTIPVSQGLTIVRILGVGLQAKPINNSFYFREWFGVFIPSGKRPRKGCLETDFGPNP